MSREYVEIDCDIVTYTSDAVLIHDGDNEVWIPLSQLPEQEQIDIITEATEGDDVTINVTEWFATKEGLV